MVEDLHGAGDRREPTGESPLSDASMKRAIRVLLVDDEEPFVRNLERLLRNRGFAVDSALDGPSALRRLTEGAGCDVVLLDVRMPGMSGIDVLREIKRLAPEAEVLMLTADATVQSGIEAMRAGALDYLVKPCDIEDLTAKIEEAARLEAIRRRPVLWPRRLVKEITRPAFLRLQPEDPLSKALEGFLAQPGMGARDELYVLDAEDRFCGVISRRDLLAAAARHRADPGLVWSDLAAHPEWLPFLPLAAILRPEHPTAIDPEADLADAARRMLAANVRCMPVLQEERVIGIVRLGDVLRHLGRQ